MASEPYPSTLQMYRSLALSVYAPSFLMSICQGAVLLVIPLYALELGGGAGIASLVFAMRGLGNMAMDVPAGYATARFGDKHTMIAGVLVMAITGIFAAMSTSAWQLSVAAFFFGAAMATWLLARLTHISEEVHVSQRGKAISTMAGLQRFGNLIGPVMTGIIADQFGWHWVFVVISILAVAALALVLIGVKHNIKGHHEESPGILTLVPHILSNHWPVFSTAGIAILCLTVIRAGRQLLVPLWGESIGLDATEIGLIAGLASGIDMIMFPLAGYMMDNWGRKYAGTSCLALLSGGLVLVPLTDTFMMLALAAMIAGMGNGLGSGINMTFGADFAPDRERGEFLGVWRLMSDSGSFAGPVAMGYVADLFLLSSAFWLTATLGFAGAAVMVLFVKETLVKSIKPAD